MKNNHKRILSNTFKIHLPVLKKDIKTFLVYKIAQYYTNSLKFKYIEEICDFT